jgi:hypothetical protein
VADARAAGRVGTSNSGQPDDTTALTGSIAAASAEARLSVIAGWTLLDIRPRNRALVRAAARSCAGAGTVERVTKVDGR